MESPEIPLAQDKQLNNYIQSQNLKNKGNFKENKGNKGVLGIKWEIKETVDTLLHDLTEKTYWNEVGSEPTFLAMWASALNQ